MWLIILKPLIILCVVGVLILTHEFGHFLAARVSGIDVTKFAIGFGPLLFKKKIKNTLFLIHAIPLGGYVKMAGDEREKCVGAEGEFFSKPVGVRARVVFFGPLFNYLCSFLIMWFLFTVGMPIAGTKIGGIIQGSPAQKAGLQEEDEILAINGKKVEEWSQMQSAVYNSKGGLNLLVKRGGTSLDVDVFPEPISGKDEYGRKSRQRQIGVYSDESNIKVVRYNVFVAFKKGAQRTITLTRLIITGFYLLFTGEISFKEGVGGPIEIYRIASRTIQYGPTALLNFVSLIGISLAIVNLLPIPVLDGGHLLLFLIEKLRGKPLNKKVEDILTHIGWLILGVLMFFVFYNDIMKIIGGN